MSDSIKFSDTGTDPFKFWGTGYIPSAASDDTICWNSDSVGIYTLGGKDNVNSPAHYTRGKQEAIEIIEEAIQDAPDMKLGYQQGQVLKYLLRLWLKDNPKEDAEKARWYLNRLIDSL